ncbi:MAG: adenylyl-sulfate kinase [Rhodospirillales bacterium]|jgi:bifunctional enzyme CysN/CysC|nr:adenylyl-sulfate kinase [Rhodospirillales bacterium]
MPEQLLRVLTCGSVDDGKSTLIGRLLFECGAVPDDILAGLEEDSRRFGTVPDDLDFALLVDGLAAEREQGVTIDVAYRYFETPLRRFILADAPGHQQYTRNMATGASTAEVAVLLVDATKGVLAQTRRHAAIAALMGVRQFVLAVNKMDLARFAEAPFAEAAAEVRTLLDRLGGHNLTAIPVVARDGDNVTRPSARMAWYHGVSLLEALEAAPIPLPPAAGPARLPIQVVLHPNATFRGYAGTVLGGGLRVGDTVVNAGASTSARVARLASMDGDRDAAAPGDAVTVVLDREIDVSRGDVLATAPAPEPTQQITARVVWMDDTALFRGRAYLLMLGAATSVATVTDIAGRLDLDRMAEEPTRALAGNEIGTVTLSLAQPLVCETYATSRELGGFILIDRLTRATVGAGMIIRIQPNGRAIYWHRLDVDKAARAALKGQRPAVLWFTGLSGAGKSTIANLVERRLQALGLHTMSLDGDNIRHGLNRDLGFTEADRVENIRRIAEVAKLFVDAGLIVLVSFISPYRAERNMARERVAVGEFLEIFVDTPVEECRRRDPKGLYARADAGQLRNFTGVDAPYEAPDAPELRLRTLEAEPERLAEQVVAELRQRGIIT